MRFISTRTHGLMDYLMGVLLVASPWLLGFAEGGEEMWVPVLCGVAVILYSLLTNYERGMMGLISMPAHLWLDGLGGALLAASPWLFGFADLVWAPHLILGIVEVGAALCTERVPSYQAEPVR